MEKNSMKIPKKTNMSDMKDEKDFYIEALQARLAEAEAALASDTVAVSALNVELKARLAEVMDLLRANPNAYVSDILEIIEGKRAIEDASHE